MHSVSFPLTLICTIVAFFVTLIGNYLNLITAIRSDKGVRDAFQLAVA